MAPIFNWRMPMTIRLRSVLPLFRSAAVARYAAVWLAVVAFAAVLVPAQDTKLGVFTDEGGVGDVTAGSKAHFDAAKGEYTITGGGANVWAAADAFYFVWKKVSGDVTLSADVQWVGTSSAEHRKAMLMIRQSLDAGSAYADAVSHGNGLTSLQFRGAANEQTYQVVAAEDGPSHLRIVKKGSSISMSFGKPGGEMKSVGPVEYVSLKDPVHVGIGVCSHVAGTLETAVFSNVKVEEKVSSGQ
jgi:TolB protein